jgi:hypothetical protein
MWKESNILKHVANPPIFDRDLFNGLPVDENFAAVRFVDACDAPDECAFAATARAEYAHVLFVFNVERDVG